MAVPNTRDIATLRNDDDDVGPVIDVLIERAFARRLRRPLTRPTGSMSSSSDAADRWSDSSG